MQQEAVPDRGIALELLHVDRGEQLDGVALDAMGVRARMRVLRLERGRKRGDRLEIRVLKELALAALDLEQMAQVARVQEHLLVRGARPLHASRGGTAAAGQPFDDREQVERAERLPDERLGAGALRAPRLLGVGAGEQHDRNQLRLLVALQPRAELGSAHAGHA